MIFSDIKTLWKTGRSWSEIKEAQEVFADKEDLEEFFKSGWSIKDVKEFKEMVETSPMAQKEDVKDAIKTVETKVVNVEPQNEVQENPFEKLAKEV